MGIYAEYLDKNMTFDDLTRERKTMLKRISEIRGGRDILVIASDLSKNNAKIAIDFTDILPVEDQLANLKGKEIDIILETPGGFAEVVEDIVRLVRGKYERVGIIIPGTAKSAGTIFTMAGDEILMGPASSLGPIDAQIQFQNKQFSADAFLEGLKVIKKEVIDTGKLNTAYVPILQNISPGEIQHCENAQNLSKKLVTKWLENYKFKYWDKHSNGKPVTQEERHTRAGEIASELRSQSLWLTHGRSIKIEDLENLKVKITDYSKNKDLNEAITRYYTLLRMSFEGTNIYKIFETSESQIFRFIGAMPGVLPGLLPAGQSPPEVVIIDFSCPKCKTNFKIQANLRINVPLQPGTVPYPLATNIFECPNCKLQSNISQARLQIEAQTGKSIV